MNDHIEQRLRSAHTDTTPPGLTERIRHAVHDEPQTPDRHGFELHRVGPIAAAVLIGCAVLPLFVGAPIKQKPLRTHPALTLGVPIEDLAQSFNASYNEQLKLFRDDVEQLSASVLRSWQPFARN